MPRLGKAGASVLQPKYPIDPKFNAIVGLTGEMDEQLAAIDRLLEDEKLLELIAADLSKRYRLTTKTGRNSTPVEVILRMLTLKHLRGLSYDQTIAYVKESLRSETILPPLFSGSTRQKYIVDCRHHSRH